MKLGRDGTVEWKSTFGGSGDDMPTLSDGRTVGVRLLRGIPKVRMETYSAPVAVRHSGHEK
jgi:hypothetical protein